LQSRRGTDWGKLDVLLLDMPPGTGDVQLQLCQDVQLDGAVAVTTPSNVAIADVLKGIEMFNSLGVPTLSVVENMAYFEVSEFEISRLKRSFLNALLFSVKGVEDITLSAKVEKRQAKG